ncbi:hypothetical protein BKA61DRAFT_688500 [Leptodontidium sp. MPI-SDFR-AT-0119]|nr:hypothetical protein BKA61DRAFT_688500 [Leptodontidium sp. MPI-SDFR-AT-0119]
MSRDLRAEDSTLHLMLDVGQNGFALSFVACDATVAPFMGRGQLKNQIRQVDNWPNCSRVCEKAPAKVYLSASNEISFFFPSGAGITTAAGEAVREVSDLKRDFSYNRLSPRNEKLYDDLIRHAIMHALGKASSEYNIPIKDFMVTIYATVPYSWTEPKPLLAEAFRQQLRKITEDMCTRRLIIQICHCEGLCSSFLFPLPPLTYKLVLDIGGLTIDASIVEHPRDTVEGDQWMTGHKFSEDHGTRLIESALEELLDSIVAQRITDSERSLEHVFRIGEYEIFEKDMRNLFNVSYLDKLGKVLVNLLANWNGPEDATVDHIVLTGGGSEFGRISDYIKEFYRNQKYPFSNSYVHQLVDPRLSVRKGLELYVGDLLLKTHMELPQWKQVSNLELGFKSRTWKGLLQTDWNFRTETSGPGAASIVRTDGYSCIGFTRDCFSGNSLKHARFKLRLKSEPQDKNPNKFKFKFGLGFPDKNPVNPNCKWSVHVFISLTGKLEVQIRSKSADRNTVHHVTVIQDKIPELEMKKILNSTLPGPVVP